MDQQGADQQGADQQDADEYKALTSCLTSFLEYGPWARQTILRPRRDKWNSLQLRDQALIAWYPDFLNSLHESILKNENFLQQMAMSVAADWGVSTDPTAWYRCTYQDFDKVRSTLKQLVREWSHEGDVERDASFAKILREVEHAFPTDGTPRSQINVLVPGCGLGRLVLEFVKRGYSCQGNEFSYHMLLMSSYMLNHMAATENYEIFPFVHKHSHQINRSNITRPVKIPDFNPLQILNTGNPETADLMSMCAGSFTDLYGPADLMSSETYTQDSKATSFRQENESRFQVVVTSYFLDTASNIIDYLRSIYHCLSEDGIWINFGPLLWHFEDDDGTIQTLNADRQPVEAPLKGLELTREDLLELCRSIGFEFVAYENNITTTYGGDIKSLSDYQYKCEFWVCKKLAKPHHTQ